MEKPDYILQMKEIRKTFGPLVANDNVNLNIERGTVHAIVGENGAGKSTLMNILTDIYKADSGDILLNGKKVVFKNSLDAARHGIGMIYQILFKNQGLFHGRIPPLCPRPLSHKASIPFFSVREVLRPLW